MYMIKKIKKFIKENKTYIIGICIMMLSQSMAFAVIKLFQNNPIYLYHPLDDKIPFIGLFVYIYDSFYIFVAISLYWIYKKDLDAFKKGIIAGTIGYLICYIIYLFLPTIMYRPAIPSIDPLTDLVIKITYLFDNPPLNCFPSIHCLFCFQVIYTFLFSKKYDNTRRKILSIIYLILIILSTLFIKQHFVYDVIGSFLVCILSNLVVEIFDLGEKVFKLIKSS